VEKVILKIQELYGVLQSAVGAVANERKAVATRQVSQEKAAQEMVDRTVDLDAREVEIKKVEDVVALKESAVKLLEDAKVQTDKLRAEAEAHTAKVEDELAKIRKVQEDITAKKAALALQEKDLKARNEKLEEDKKNYKDDIIKEIVTKK